MMMRGNACGPQGGSQAPLPLSVPLPPLFFPAYIMVRRPGATFLQGIFVLCLTFLFSWSLTDSLHFALDLGFLTQHFELSF